MKRAHWKRIRCAFSFGKEDEDEHGAADTRHGHSAGYCQILKTEK